MWSGSGPAQRSTDHGTDQNCAIVCHSTDHNTGQDFGQDVVRLITKVTSEQINKYADNAFFHCIHKQSLPNKLPCEVEKTTTSTALIGRQIIFKILYTFTGPL